MMLKVLGFKKGRAFAAFRRIVIQDGSSFAIHDGLREVFPGRFKVVKPAAVELHTTMELLCDAPPTVVLTPDTTSEQAFLPEPSSLRASMLLAERGYVDLHYLRRVQDAGGFFLIRAKAGMNPQVLEAFREDGKRLRSLRNKPLQTIHTKLPKRQRVELMVRWDVDGAPLCLRLIVSWNRRTKSFCYFLTNLPSPSYPLEVICRAYKWRWQVELLFKEWKSYANLHAFDTANAVIVEGLIWVAIAARFQLGKDKAQCLTACFLILPVENRACGFDRTRLSTCDRSPWHDHEASVPISPVPRVSTRVQLPCALGTFVSLFSKARGLRHPSSSWCARLSRAPTTMPHPTLP